MERDKNLRNYITLKNLEDDYYKAKNSIKEYKPMNEGLALLLFLLLIIPGVIYVSKKKIFLICTGLVLNGLVSTFF